MAFSCVPQPREAGELSFIVERDQGFGTRLSATLPGVYVVEPRLSMTCQVFPFGYLPLVPRRLWQQASQTKAGLEVALRKSKLDTGLDWTSCFMSYSLQQRDGTTSFASVLLLLEERNGYLGSQDLQHSLILVRGQAESLHHVVQEAV